VGLQSALHPTFRHQPRRVGSAFELLRGPGAPLVRRPTLSALAEPATSLVGVDSVLGGHDDLRASTGLAPQATFCLPESWIVCYKISDTWMEARGPHMGLKVGARAFKTSAYNLPRELRRGGIFLFESAVTH
jgi:hypothetical protein